MKKISLILLALVLTKCASVKRNSAPFKIKNAVFNQSEKKLDIAFQSNKDFEFQHIFYKGGVQETEVTEVGAIKHLIGRFKKRDLTLHADAKKEFGNTSSIQKPPFEIKKNQAVVSYKEKGEIKYFTIKNITVQ